MLTGIVGKMVHDLDILKANSASTPAPINVSPLETQKINAIKNIVAAPKSAASDLRVTMSDINQIIEVKKMLERESSVEESKSSIKPNLVTDIYKVVREFWADDTHLSLNGFHVAVPSDLNDSSASTLNIDASMELSMLYSMLTKTKYDIQN